MLRLHLLNSFNLKYNQKMMKTTLLIVSLLSAFVHSEITCRNEQFGEPIDW